MAEPRFHLIARRQEAPPGSETQSLPRFRLFNSSPGEVFISYGPWLMPVQANGRLAGSAWMLRGIEPRLRDPLEAGLLVSWSVQAAGGRWPNDFFISIRYVTSSPESDEPEQLYRWTTHSGWKRVDVERRRYSAYARRIEPWSDQSVLALRGFRPRYTRKYDELGAPAAEQRAIEKAIAKVKPLAVIRGVPKSPQLAATIIDFAAMESGQIIAVAAAGSDRSGGGALRAIHYDSATASTAAELPESRGVEIRGVELISADRAYIYGGREDESRSPYLTRYDGTSWVLEQGPPCGAAIFAISWAKPSGLWAACESDAEYDVDPSGDLWHLTSGGWIEIEFPLRGSVTGVAADGPRGVWVSTSSAVYGPKAPEQIREFGGYDDLAIRIAEYAEPSPTPFRCRGNLDWYYVLLSGAVAGSHEFAAERLDRVLAGQKAARQVNLAVVEYRNKSRFALQIHGAIDDDVLAGLQRAFVDDAMQTVCFGRAPSRTIP